ALPMLFGSSMIEIIPPVESRPYINITADVFRLFGVEVKESADDRFMIQGNQQFMPANTRVEGDWSNAAFLEAIARLAAPHGLEITGLKEDSLQGDKCCVELFEKLSAGGNSMIDISECPDLGPVLFAYAAASGGGHFTGIRRLRIKESDRAEAMAEVLLKFGIRSIIYENEMDILPGELKTPAGPVSGHNDHRIVMAAAVLMLLTGGCIEEAQAVRKSYPDFFETLNSIGIKTYTEEEA
ncbi:MAG: 3-phosphoshikimate 1-carboxyvinyltransferase, partial [Lachnospiraceae bacterium]|nr:3-phosphoshikimate 1-carboxyvinyltransferase [Lachnospiraceae bacterium]